MGDDARVVKARRSACSVLRALRRAALHTYVRLGTPLSFSHLHTKHERIAARLTLLSVLTCMLITLFSFSNLQGFLGLTVASNLIFAMVIYQPPEPGLLALFGSYHMVSLLLVISWHCTLLEPTPPPSGFVVEPFAFVCVIFMIQIIAAERNFPLSFKLCFLVVTTSLHMIVPMFSIGPTEPLLVLSGNLAGLVGGYALNSDHQRLLGMLEIAAINRRADSRLNHVIKGQCGGANGFISAILARLDTEPESAFVKELRESLKDVQGMLNDAADWCHSREVFVQLESNRYVSKMSRISLRSYLKTQVRPSDTVDSIEEVVVDRNLVRLFVHEALSNAFKYSEPRSTLSLKAFLEEDNGSIMLNISITNHNRKDVPHLTESECIRAFLAKSKQISSVANERTERSDGVGLTSVKLAAEAVGGVAWLHADKQFTTLNFKLPAVRCPPQAAEPIEVPDLPAELGATQAPGVRAKRQPESLVNKSTDCMSSQTIVPIAAQETHTPPEISFLEPSKLLNDCATSQRRGGDEGVDKPPERPQLTAAGCPSERKLLHPVCIGIDDSLMLRKMQMSLFRVFLKADESRSGSIGGTIQEVETFIDVVMGRRTLYVSPLPCASASAHAMLPFPRSRAPAQTREVCPPLE